MSLIRDRQIEFIPQRIRQPPIYFDQPFSNTAVTIKTVLQFGQPLHHLPLLLLRKSRRAGGRDQQPKRPGILHRQVFGGVHLIESRMTDDLAKALIAERLNDSCWRSTDASDFVTKNRLVNRTVGDRWVLPSVAELQNPIAQNQNRNLVILVNPSQRRNGVPVKMLVSHYQARVIRHVPILSRPSDDFARKGASIDPSTVKRIRCRKAI